MKINILLPHKEKFNTKKASSVSITVKNNLSHTKFLNDIRIFGQDVESPLFEQNFIGFKYSILSLKSKNKFLASEMLKVIANETDDNQLIEIHNRPYLVDVVSKQNKFPIILFFHNDPKKMKGSKSVNERKKLLNKCNYIFCVSNYIKKLFLEGITKDANKVQTLYNGVEYKTQKFPIKKKEILFVGRLVPEKGAHLFVKAMKSISFSYPNWDFGLIGSIKLGELKNDNSYAQKIISEFTSIGSQAKFYGFKDQNFVQKKMKTAAIIVIPSIWEEPFGLVAAEAMSNSMCIIASKVGGIPEIIGDNGILIENINHRKIINSIKPIISNDKMRIDYQKRAHKNFTFSSKLSSKRLDGFRKTIFASFD